MKRRLIPCLLAMLVLVNLPITFLHASATAMTPFEHRLVSAVGAGAIAKLEAQKGAVDAYTALCEYYTSANGEVVFPDDYGGEYIIDNVLHVYLTDLSKDTLLRYAEIFAGYEDDVTFEKVEYSYNDLARLQLEAEAILGDAVLGSYVNTRTNSIVIQTAEESVAASTVAISEAKSLPVGPIVVERVEESIPTAQIHGGDAIYSMGETQPFTIAVCGSYDGQPAILTSGHGLTEGQSLGITGSSPAFNVEYVQYASGEAGDYAICSVTNASHTTTYQMKYYNNVYIPVDGVYNNSNLANGMTLIKYGRNTGFSTIQIEAKECSTVHEYDTGSISISGMVKARIVEGNALGGDSGGPIFSYAYGECALAGVHSSALPKEAAVRTHVYFTPYSLVTTDFLINLSP